MSFFRQQISYLKQFKKTFVSPGKNLLYQKHVFKLLSYIAEKRMSFFSSLHKKQYRASMAVEAAMAVPFFLFFLINILCVFDMLRLHGKLTAAMHQTGNRMAFYGYAYKQAGNGDALLSEGLDSVVLSEGYARGRVIDILGEDYLNHTCLASGTGGLHFLKSSIMKEDDVIELTVSYKVKPVVKVIGFPDFLMENRYYGRAWTGYDVERKAGDSGEDPIVYVAQTGDVYHMARNCTYLNPSVEAVVAAAAEDLRNDSGGRYYPCDRCSISEFQPVVYITSQGSRMHGSVNCSGLKRTVYTIHLSEVGDRGRCSKCG